MPCGPGFPLFPFSPLGPGMPFGPGFPLFPFSPGDPRIPFDPGSPLSPLPPLGPVGPDVPVSPVFPGRPMRPLGPFFPFAPLLPRCPFAPVGPGSPGGPAGQTFSIDLQYLRGISCSNCFVNSFLTSWMVTLIKVSFKTCLRFLGLVVVNANFDHGIAVVKILWTLIIYSFNQD